MKPSHIRVFDGLRITTEHVEHLQGSLHSAVQDLREILGLGKVFSGFEVQANTNESVTVSPGLAFDYEKNRIVCQEPKPLTVAFRQDEHEKYVCIKYEQVEDGHVEGQFTMVWDSCGVELKSVQPTADENLIAIAKLTKSEHDNDFLITKLKATDEVEIEPSEDEKLESRTTDVDAATDSSSEAAGSDEPAMDDTVAFDDVEAAANGSTEHDEGGGTEKSPVESPSPVAVADRPAAHLEVRQGVARFSGGELRSGNLSSLVLEPLITKRPDASSVVELSYNLGRHDIDLGIVAASVTTQSTIRLSVSIASAATDEPDATVESPADRILNCQSTSRGEATLSGSATTVQFGLAEGNIPAGRYPMWSQEGIAFLPLEGCLSGLRDEERQLFGETLGASSVLVSIDHIDQRNVNIVCNLLWRGPVSDQTLEVLKSSKLGLAWEIATGWKALGQADLNST